MAGSRGGAFFGGVVATLAIGCAAGLVVVYGGLYNVAATSPHTAVGHWILDTAMEHSVHRQAGAMVAPARFSAAQVADGGREYKGMCARCHGGPGVAPGRFTRGMLPSPPDLSEAARHWQLRDIFWIAKHGVKMTAMPAFDQLDSDPALWNIAAFVKQLPTMSPGTYAAIPAAPAH